MNDVFCVFCDNEAEWKIDNTKTPICCACKNVYECGQDNPKAAIDAIDAIDAIEAIVE